MLKAELLEIIANGENSGVEFKLDDIRPEQLAKEAVGMANLRGGVILLGVSDEGVVVGTTRSNLEEWVMDTVFGRYIHPVIIHHYQQFMINDKIIAVISISVGTAKPYVVRHNNREDMYVRIGSISRLATREQSLRLFWAGGLLHTETLPVSGTSLINLDKVRIENYLRDILSEPDMPKTDAEWFDRLGGLGFLTTDSVGQKVCTIAGLVLFGMKPRRHLPQAGLRVMVFDVADKQYQALLDVVLDAPAVGRWNVEKGKTRVLIDDGLIEKFVQAIEPFITVEANEVDRSFRREKTWLYPLEAVREVVLNALVHRDWTRSVDIEITRYVDRLEVTSPGALPNSMTIEKMKAGRRTPRNPVILEVMRDYGYVDARGMGVRTKIIPLTKQFTGAEPLFEDTDDFLKIVIQAKHVPENVPEKLDMSLKNGPDIINELESTQSAVPEKRLHDEILSIIKDNPDVTYDELSLKTGKNRKTIQRHLQTLKGNGLLQRIGSAKGGHWKVVEV